MQYKKIIIQNKTLAQKKSCVTYRFTCNLGRSLNLSLIVPGKKNTAGLAHCICHSILPSRWGNKFNSTCRSIGALWKPHQDSDHTM